MTMHTSITRGDVWCKKQSFPGEDEDKEDDDKEIENSRVRKLALAETHNKLRRHCLSYRRVCGP